MNRGSISTALSWLSGLAATLALSCATAQEPVVDPPDRVGRLSLIEGDVSLAPAQSEEWADAVLNRPLTTGDKLWVEENGRAELQVDSSTIHLDHGTGFSFIELDDDVMQMSLTDGAATIRVRRLGERETIQVETPNATITLRDPGEYHFEVDVESDRTVVKARSGEAEIVGKLKSYVVRANEAAVLTGLEDLHATINPIAPRTAFEAWANDRDRERNESNSSRYVSENVVGYEELDDNGEWVHEPEYGHVWRPTYVVHDWAPYRYGRWLFVRPWGWTWVDDARWGFAPFHYGRWAYLRHRWCWVPGPRHVRAVYAPAHVGWIGSPSLSVSVSFGSGIGWYPLGPHEVYRPWYRHTPRYIRHVNVSNTIIVNNTHITNIYNGRHRPRDFHHRRNEHAVTVVQRDQFVGGRSLGGHRLRVDERELRQWRDDARPSSIEDARPSSIEPVRQSILAGEPRRGGHPARTARNVDPKERGDFRTPRQGVNAGDIKRHENLARDRRHVPDGRNGADRDRTERVAVRDQTSRDQNTRGRGGASPGSGPESERLEVMQGETRRGDTRGQSLRPDDRSRPDNQDNRLRSDDSQRDSMRRDHMERPPAAVRSLQSNPPEQRRESVERSAPRQAPSRQEFRRDSRDEFRRDSQPRQLQPAPQRQVQPAPQRQVQPAPQRQVQPAPQRQIQPAPQPRSEPRNQGGNEARSHGSTRSSESRSSSRNSSSDAPRARESRSHGSSRRPD